MDIKAGSFDCTTNVVDPNGILRVYPDRKGKEGEAREAKMGGSEVGCFSLTA